MSHQSHQAYAVKNTKTGTLYLQTIRGSKESAESQRQMRIRHNSKYKLLYSGGQIKRAIYESEVLRMQDILKVVPVLVEE